MIGKAVGIVVVLVAVVLAALVGLNGSVAPLFTSVSMPNVGVVQAVEVGVYWDGQCSDEVSVIDWGVVEPGSAKEVVVFVRNEGNAAVSLSINTTNWNPPSASDFITLSWDYGEQTVEPNEVVQVTLILLVSPSIEGISTFSFDVHACMHGGCWRAREVVLFLSVSSSIGGITSFSFDIVIAGSG